MELTIIKEIHGNKLYVNNDTLEFVIKKTYAANSEELLKQLKNIAPLCNIPEIYGYEVVDNQINSYEQYIVGETLADLLSYGTMIQINTFYSKLFNLVQCLNTLHENNILHRDIKPENIILSHDDIFLIDFNIARQKSEDKVRDTTHIGTEGYASPEQYGFSQTTEKSDIYSLGITIQTCINHLTFDKEIDNILIELVNSMTNLDPKQRPSIIHVIEQLNKVINGNPKANVETETVSEQSYFEPKYFLGFINVSKHIIVNSLITIFFVWAVYDFSQTYEFTLNSLKNIVIFIVLYYVSTIALNYYCNKFSIPHYKSHRSQNLLINLGLIFLHGLAALFIGMMTFGILLPY